ncbi:hypothetical protein [Streptomyces griseorubiginosus]|uniref:hypothetical protein n=1 Tax=Streptomyces griseorubiginosus TaxID=67304 RepID=UPI0036EA9D61
MARSPRKSSDSAKPLLKPPVRIGSLSPKAILSELRKLHEAAEDKNISTMPADDEVFQALLYLETNAGALKDAKARRKAALDRVKLWEYLREQADIHQAKAVEDARAAGAEWADLAGPLAVNAPSAAYNKAKRLKAAVLSTISPHEPPVRRTPEAVLEVERQAAIRAAAARRAEEAAARRHALLAPVAQRLLEHRTGLDDDGEITYWLDQIAEVLPSCQTPTQLVSLEIYVAAAVREMRKAERAAGRWPATTEARLAYAAAVEVIAG